MAVVGGTNRYRSVKQSTKFNGKSRELDFQLISHIEPVIYFQDEVTVEFKTKKTPLSNITADFRDSEGREVNRHRYMVKMDSKTFSMRVNPLRQVSML